MKQVIETDEVSGFEAVLGKSVYLICNIYIYTGTLSGVNSDHLELTNPKLVYETGEWDAVDWKDAQQLPSPHRVMRDHVESWGPGK